MASDPMTTRSDPLAGHDIRDIYFCRRCRKSASEIVDGKLRCISEARAAGNVAIGRIVSRR